MVLALLTGLLGVFALGGDARAEISAEELARRIPPPMAPGQRIGEAIWEIENSGGEFAGYAFETEPLAPIPGFSGAPINVLVVIDREGQFLDAQIITQNEPVFVSGLGEAPFHAFVAQYRGHALSDPITVGVPYGAHGGSASTNVYLDGVTKATASVRIANETILAASLAVARERLQGIKTQPAAAPDTDHDEPLDWPSLLESGIAVQYRVLNGDVETAFAGTDWADEDPQARADPDGLYTQMTVLDLGPPSIARAALSADALREIEAMRAVDPHSEPILVLSQGRHALLAPDFVRNTAPDRLSASQNGFPLALRDADIFVDLSADAPDFDEAIILRVDRRLGFDPASPWTLSIRALREKGIFMPAIGSVDLPIEVQTPERFFRRPKVTEPDPVWLAAIKERRVDLIAAGALLIGLLGALSWRLDALARQRWFPAFRLGVLAITTGFVGYWAQGQLSIVTPLGVLRSSIEGGSLNFLLYDPFSLLIWLAAIIGLVLWGRGLFCGWLCPFGAMQEFADRIGRGLGLRQIKVPERLDRALKWVKYAALAALIGAALYSGPLMDSMVEIEPFKTAITVGFQREWFYVAYASLWLVLGLVIFKPFCRYLCPLGAFLALGGKARRLDWIERRAECGSPCQLCKVRCPYGAIERSGRIDYDECFQCLDCVTIYHDTKQCVPLVLADKRRAKIDRSASVSKSEPILEGA
ncbi:MAG: 4Fe-4S binding protein [Neomegalonema sp.]|nr:4Fe-4S binding protein [Neomegalonema sp.]